MKVLLTVLALLWLGVPLPPAIAQSLPISAVAQATSTQTLTGSQALERLFTQPVVEAEWFADRFLSQISIDQIQQIVQSLPRNLGAFQRVESAGDRYRLVFEQGIVPAQIQLNQAGQITLLFFQPPQLSNVSLDQIVTAFEALPGEVHLLIRQGDETLAAIAPETPLAVGSAFKLVVLQALQQQIAAGTLRWNQVISLDPAWQSLPSGILQRWPADTPLTVQTLATLMISLSDNTATDALINIVGTDAIEALSPRNRPFLTTRAAFILKNPANQNLLNRYLQAEDAERRSLLATLGNYSLPAVEIFTGEPVALEIEWFFTATELCNGIATVANLPLMQVEPGLADPTDWRQVAYKGGAEPGVLNFTTHLTAANGSTYCITATWNRDVALDEAQFAGLYQSAIAALKQASHSATE
ncbi:MAG: serine hydrolase [Cyanobacteria bacterium P01_D01_bin.128]